MDEGIASVQRGMGVMGKSNSQKNFHGIKKQNREIRT